MAEGDLMEPLAGQASHVCPPRHIGQFLGRVQVAGQRVIHRYGERKASRGIANNEDRPFGDVLTRVDTVEVDERQLEPHHLAEAVIVAMVGVSSPVSLLQQTVSAELVLIWPGLAGNHRYGGDTQWEFEHCWLEDPLRARQRDAAALINEACPEARSRAEPRRTGA